MTPEHEEYLGLNLIIGIMLCGLLTMPAAAWIFGSPITRPGGFVVWLCIVSMLIGAHVINRRNSLARRAERNRNQYRQTPALTLLKEEEAA